MQRKCAIVTGGAVRLGRSIVLGLHERGYDIAVHFNQSLEAALSLVSELNQQRPGSAEKFHGNLKDLAVLDSLPARVISHFGCIDALVNNASSYFKTPMGTIRQSAWDDLLNTNMRAPLLLSQSCAPHLKASRGVIINITDIHAEFPARHFAVYSAAKAGLLGLTRSLAIELSPDVRVNAVAPGAIQWPEGNVFSEEEKTRIVSGTLLKREGSPEDIAKTVAFLVADAPYITGQVIQVDGGRTLCIGNL